MRVLGEMMSGSTVRQFYAIFDLPLAVCLSDLNIKNDIPRPNKMTYQMSCLVFNT